MGDFTPIRQSWNPPAARLAAQSSWLPVPPSARGVASRTLLTDLYREGLLEVYLAEREIALLPNYVWKNVPKGRVGQQKPKHIPRAAAVCSARWTGWSILSVTSLSVRSLVFLVGWDTSSHFRLVKGCERSSRIGNWLDLGRDTQPSSVAVLRHGFPCVHVRPKWIARVEQKVGVTREAVRAGVLEDKD